VIEPESPFRCRVVGSIHPSAVRGGSSLGYYSRPGENVRRLAGRLWHRQPTKRSIDDNQPGPPQIWIVRLLKGACGRIFKVSSGQHP